MKRSALLSILVCLSLGTTVAFADETVDTDTVVVTAKRYVAPTETVQQKTLKEQSNTTVVTADDIEKNHYTTAQEALKNVNGVTFTDMVPGMSSSIRLNGSERVLVLVDGKSLTNPQNTAMYGGNTDMSALPDVGSIERIEVTKGSGSVKYGSGAVGGVVNIITKKGDTNKTTLDARTGSWGSHGYTLTNQGSQGDTSWFASYNMDRQKYFDYAGGVDNKADTNFHNESFTARIDQQLTNDTSLTVDAFHKTMDGQYTKFDITAFPEFEQTTDKKGNKTLKPVRRLYNNVSVAYNFDEDTDMPGFIRYYNNYNRIQWSNNTNVRTQGVQAEKGWHVGNHSITAGAEYTYEAGSDEGSSYNDKTRNNKAFYLEDAMDFGKLTVTPGIRLDDNSNSGFHKTPRIAANYKANDKLNIYGNWSRVYNEPSLTDLYKSGRYNGGHGAGSYDYVSNPDLKPETGYTQTIGTTYSFDDNTSLDISLFRVKLNDAIKWDYVDGSQAMKTPFNINQEEQKGIDLTFNKIINDTWDYNLGYTYTKYHAEGIKYYYNQPNSYHAGLNFNKDKWHANVAMNAGTGRQYGYYLADSFVTWDLGVSYDANKDTTVYAKVNNLTNEGYDLYHGYPELGRFYQAGVKYSF